MLKMFFTSLLDYGFYMRAISVTLFALILFRVSSSRLFGQHSLFDLIIFIILGAILGEGVVTPAHFLPSLISCMLIVLVHRGLAFLSFQNKFFAKWIRGVKVIFYKNGSWNKATLNRCYLSEAEVLQSLRCIHGLKNLDHIDEIALERNGQLSFILDNADYASPQITPQN